MDGAGRPTLTARRAHSDDVPRAVDQRVKERQRPNPASTADPAAGDRDDGMHPRLRSSSARRTAPPVRSSHPAARPFPAARATTLFQTCPIMRSREREILRQAGPSARPGPDGARRRSRSPGAYPVIRSLSDHTIHGPEGCQERRSAAKRRPRPTSRGVDPPCAGAPAGAPRRSASWVFPRSANARRSGGAAVGKRRARRWRARIRPAVGGRVGRTALERPTRASPDRRRWIGRTTD